MPSSRPRWSRYRIFRQEMSREAQRNHDGASCDWWEKSPLRIEPSSSPATHLVYLTKRGFLQFLKSHTPDDQWPTPELRGITWITRYGLVTRGVAAQVTEVARQAQAPVVFLGDLDPFDLATFMSLDAQLERHGISPRYGGLRGDFVDRCLRRFPLHTIDLEPFERAAWQRLKREPAMPLAPTGPEATLLDGGAKLELEGTMWNWHETRAEFAGMLIDAVAT